MRATNRGARLTASKRETHCGALSFVSRDRPQYVLTVADAQTVAVVSVVVAGVSSLATVASAVWMNHRRLGHERTLDVGKKAHERELRDKDELRGILDEALAAAAEGRHFVFQSGPGSGDEGAALRERIALAAARLSIRLKDDDDIVRAYNKILSHYENCLVLLFGGDDPLQDHRDDFAGHELEEFFGEEVAGLDQSTSEFIAAAHGLVRSRLDD